LLAGALQLVQVRPHERLVRCRNPELFAVGEAILVVFNFWSSQLWLRFTAIGASHVLLTLFGLQKLDTRQFGLLFLCLLLLALVLARREKHCCRVHRLLIICEIRLRDKTVQSLNRDHRVVISSNAF